MRRANGRFAIIVASAVLIFNLFQFTYALIPLPCKSNLTRSNAVCCPRPYPGAEPCGGPGRGICAEYQVYQEYGDKVYDDGQELDDRLQWPKRLFKYGCHCDNNYWGYACQECWYGWTGKKCNVRTFSRRRNIISYTAKEKRLFQKIMLKAHKVKSKEYVLYLDQDGRDSDPLKDPRFVTPTVHQTLVFLHRYTSRSTMYKSKKACDVHSHFNYDFNHNGVGFVTWHRYFMLFWERQVAKLAKKYYGVKDFRFPYWDWTDSKTCAICTKDIIGDLSSKNPSKNTSPFRHWVEYCAESDQERCNGCHTRGIYDQPWPNMTRIFNRDYTFPPKSQVDFTTTRQYYFKSLSKVHCDSFVKSLEGECSSADDISDYAMHNGVHSAVTGAFSGSAGSANDPLFPIHHTQVDRVFSKWFRRFRPHPREMPNRDIKAGHCRDCNMVGFFPPIPHHMMFVDTRALGYDYDTMRFEKTP